MRDRLRRRARRRPRCRAASGAPADPRRRRRRPGAAGTLRRHRPRRPRPPARPRPPPPAAPTRSGAGAGRRRQRAAAGHQLRRPGRRGRTVRAALRTARWSRSPGSAASGSPGSPSRSPRRERDRFADGGWLCELAPLDDGGPVGARRGRGAAACSSVTALTIEQTRRSSTCAGRSLLLVLDNCEHVLDAAGTAGRTSSSRHCPGVVVLATSRERARRRRRAGRGRCRRCRSRTRARCSSRGPAPPGPTSDPDGRTRQAVAEICRRLDGLPLGIELAAARTRAMSAAEVAARLDGGSLLSRGARGRAAPATRASRRPSTGPTACSTSAEQALFARLSVFAGGFDLEAAHGVCGEPGDSRGRRARPARRARRQVDGVGVERRRPPPATACWRRCAPTAASASAAAAERRSAARARRTTSRGSPRQAAARAAGPDERAWVERALPDYDNLRAAFERAFADRDADLALRLVDVDARADAPARRLRGRRRGRSARSSSSPTGATRCAPAAVGVAARGAWNRGEFARAARRSPRGPGAARRAGAPGASPTPADVLADVALYEGDAEAALAHYAAEVERARRDDDPIRLVWTLYYVAICHAVRRAPGRRRRRRARRPCGRRARPATRPRCRWPATRWAWCSRSPSPDGRWRCSTRPRELAASVRNFWWDGIALMEAAATRAVHGDPAAGARRVPSTCSTTGTASATGPSSGSTCATSPGCWSASAPTTTRVALHHSLVAAGKPSAARPGRPRGAGRRPRTGAVRRRGPARVGPRRIRSRHRRALEPAARPLQSSSAPS